MTRSETATSNDPSGQFDIGGGNIWHQVMVYFLLFMIAVKVSQVIVYLWEVHPWLPK